MQDLFKSGCPLGLHLSSDRVSSLQAAYPDQEFVVPNILCRVSCHCLRPRSNERIMRHLSELFASLIERREDWVYFFRVKNHGVLRYESD